MRACALLIALMVPSALIGCGPSAPGPLRDAAAGGDAATGGAGRMTWKDDGTLNTAAVYLAYHDLAATTDTLQMIGATTTGASMTLDVVTVGKPLVAGPYTCAQNGIDPLVILTYTAVANMTTSCTINVVQPGTPGGAHATGTFSALLQLNAGGAKTITEGTFDTPVTASTN